MRLSYEEIRAVHFVRRRVEFWRRGILTPDEIIHSVIDGLVDCEGGAGRVISHCVASLPGEFLASLKEYVEGRGETGHPSVSLVVGRGPSPEERARLEARLPAVIEGIREFLSEVDSRPELLKEKASLEVDFFWATLQELPRIADRPCSSPGCTEPSISVSVHCARHHYEQMEGKIPPKD